MNFPDEIIPGIGIMVQVQKAKEGCDLLKESKEDKEMKMSDFEKLNVGDYCTFRMGFDKGKQCVVIWKEGNYALVGSVDGNPLTGGSDMYCCPYRLTNYNTLAVWKSEES